MICTVHLIYTFPETFPDFNEASSCNKTRGLPEEKKEKRIASTPNETSLPSNLWDIANIGKIIIYQPGGINLEATALSFNLH